MSSAAAASAACLPKPFWRGGAAAKPSIKKEPTTGGDMVFPLMLCMPVLGMHPCLKPFGYKFGKLK